MYLFEFQKHLERKVAGRKGHITRGFVKEKKLKVTYLLGHSEQEVSISVLPCPHEPWFSRSRSGSELHGVVRTGVS